MRQLYRVTLFVRPDYVESARTTGGQKGFLEDVRRRASALGFSPSLLETQDPTDGRIVILLAQQTGSIGEHDDVIRVLKVEPVEEPPAGTEKANVRSHAFDPGLSVAEVEMIQHALKGEHNPRHLWGLASSLEPSFPIAASLLRARKVAVESNTPPPVVDAPRPDPALAILRRRAVDVEAMRCGLPADVVDEDCAEPRSRRLSVRPKPRPLRCSGALLAPCCTRWRAGSRSWTRPPSSRRVRSAEKKVWSLRPRFGSRSRHASQR